MGRILSCQVAPRRIERGVATRSFAPLTPQSTGSPRGARGSNAQAAGGSATSRVTDPQGPARSSTHRPRRPRLAGISKDQWTSAQRTGAYLPGSPPHPPPIVRRTATTTESSSLRPVEPRRPNIVADRPIASRSVSSLHRLGRWTPETPASVNPRRHIANLTSETRTVARPREAEEGPSGTSLQAHAEVAFLNSRVRY